MTLVTLKRLIAIAAAAGSLALVAAPASALVTREEPRAPAGGFSFEGPFGTYDQAQLQRGYKVYREVCSSCHAMRLMHFRDLAMKGGPFWEEKYQNPNDNPYVKQIASEYQIADIDTQTGDPIKRKGTPADAFPSPYPNDAAAAAANGGATPPDQSTLAKAREGGAEYIYSLLTGYVANPPAGLKMNPGQYYNPYMPGDLSSYWSGKGETPKGGFIAMPPPLTDDRVSFDDGTKATLKQEAADVAAFLAWASDPHETDRKETGFAVLVFLLIFAGLTYVSYKRIWRNVAH